MQEQTWQSIATISSPAKAILCGEHSVVYGEDAIAIGINLRCNGTIFRQKNKHTNQHLFFMQFIEQNGQLHILQFHSEVLQDWKQEVQQQNNYLKDFNGFKMFLENRPKYAKIYESYQSLTFHYKVCQFLTSFMQIFDLNCPYTYKLIINSKIPIGKCLGSSASFNTVLATALIIIFKSSQEEEPSNISHSFGCIEELKCLINEISLRFECVEHGTPSGIDNFVSVFGGLVLYNKLSTPKFVRLPQEIIQKIKQQLFIGVIDSGIIKNTKIAVMRVKEKCQQDIKCNFLLNISLDQKIIKQIGTLVKQVIEVLQSNKKSWKVQLFQLLKQNHAFLKEFELSNENIETIINENQIQNLICGKITGSGMGGCVLFLGDKVYNEKLSQNMILTEIDEKGLEIHWGQ